MAMFTNTNPSTGDDQWTLLAKLLQLENTGTPSGQFVTPEQYGAVGDGITDDSAAIQAALNASSFVLFGKKSYRLASQVVFNAGNMLFGQGIGASVLILDTGLDGLYTEASFTSIQHMTIRGISSAQRCGTAISLGNSSITTGNTCNMESVEVKWATLGLYNGSYDGVSLRNCVFQINNTHIQSDGNVAMMKVTDCILNDTTVDTVQVTRGGNIFISGGNMNNTATSNSGYAVHVISGVAVLQGVQFERVQNATPGAYYIFAETNTALTLNSCLFQDGNIAMKHIKCGATSSIRVQDNLIYGNTTGRFAPVIDGNGSGFDIRSSDMSGDASFNGVYTFRVSPWHTYDSQDVLPTASVESENMYSVVTRDSPSGSTDVATYIKKQAGGVWSYVLLA